MWSESKLLHVAEWVLEDLKEDRVRFSNHALDRLNQRLIPLGLDESDVFRILRSGRREFSKDRWDSVFMEWAYAFRGRCLDGTELRIVVSVSNEFVVIVTMMDLD